MVGLVSICVSLVLVMHDGHVEISWVLELWTLEVEIIHEVVVTIFCFSLVDYFSLDHEEKVIEECVYFRVGLMDG